MLDASGNDIDSTLNYTLKATDATLPVTPMTFKGMYVYMADAAIFRDCATGKQFPVSNNIALEQGYSHAPEVFKFYRRDAVQRTYPTAVHYSLDELGRE